MTVDSETDTDMVAMAVLESAIAELSDIDATDWEEDEAMVDVATVSSDIVTSMAATLA